MSQTPYHPASPESQPEKPVRIALTPAGGLGQVHVGVESFVAFNIWMTRELTALEDRFYHFQTPKSGSRRRNLRP